MSFKMMSPPVPNRTGKENIVDVLYGLGEDIAADGDREQITSFTTDVAFMYHVFNKEGFLQDYGGPLELTLGTGKYGSVFDEGIRGMKIQGVRRIYTAPNKDIRVRQSFFRKALYKLKLKRLPDLVIYQVSVIAFLDENGRFRPVVTPGQCKFWED
ncbi:uncharacterized protein LOC129321745 [Prosopis cineraria]|uniref:uncharacterized protein LOC129321745 n=1 Tax=Prosopis cineraria TaxID=364024 RepID=UPI00240F2527|nr:uncharacterized protein LOC129321745 [Prosopis cineraria]